MTYCSYLPPHLKCLKHPLYRAADVNFLFNNLYKILSFYQDNTVLTIGQNDIYPNVRAWVVIMGGSRATSPPSLMRSRSFSKLNLSIRFPPFRSLCASMGR